MTKRLEEFHWNWYESETISGIVAECGRAESNHIKAPEGTFLYRIRGSDSDWTEPCTIEENVVVNHCGILLTKKQIDFGDTDFIDVENDLDTCLECVLYSNEEEDHVSLEEFLKSTPTRTSTYFL